MPFKAVFETGLTDVWTALQAGDVGDKAGDLRWERDTEGMKCYKCVLLDLNAVTPIVGMAAYYSAGTSGNGYTIHEVTMDFGSADTFENGAGIWQSIPAADGDRCWIQIKGFATVIAACFGATVADGQPLTAADASVDGELELANAASDLTIGVCIDDGDLRMICDFPF